MGPPAMDPEKAKDEGDGSGAPSSQPRPIQIVTSTMAREFEKSATEIAASVSSVLLCIVYAVVDLCGVAA